MELRTPRLRLRPYEPRDFDLLFRELVLDPAVVGSWDDYADPALSVEQKRSMAAHDLGSWMEEGMAAGYPAWVLLAADPLVGPDGDFVGAANVYPAENEWGPEPEVGCMLASRHHGRGLATEALAAVVADAAERLGVRAVVGVLDERNTASIRLVEKCGFVLDRVFVAADGRAYRRYVHRS